MEDKRKKWTTPQLIVLGRGTPEENVLAGCKTATAAGPTGSKTGCVKKIGINCKNTCSTISATS